MDQIQIIYDKQKKYNIVRSYYIYRDFVENGSYNYSLELSLCENVEDSSRDSFDIVFHDITDFKINDIDNMFRIVLDIEDITNYQNEFVKFLVKEIEYEMFSFGCVSIEIL